MRYIILLAAIFILVLGSSAAQVAQRNVYNLEVETMTNDVPGVTLNGNERQASAKQGYVFAQESPKSISVIKIVGKGSAQLQTGTLECVPVSKTDPHEAYCAAFIQSKTLAYCQGRARCHFVGILGGVRAP